MAENNTVLVVAVLAVIASLAAAGFSYYSLSNQKIVTGFAGSDTGTAKLNVATETTLNFSVDMVDFGTGRVNIGETYATLETGVDPSVEGHGTWTGTQDPLILDNIGNTNVSLELKADTDAIGFLGGTGPSFQIKVTDSDVGACGDTTAAFGDYQDINSTDVTYCDSFQYLSNLNKLQIDVKLVVPENSKLGALSSTITATGTA